jgi:acid phosphatase (class A)
MRLKALVLGGWVLALAGAAIARQAPQAAPAAARPSGYLSALPDAGVILRPSPKDGDPRDLEDRRIFDVSRRLADSPRWAMAQADVPTAIASVMGGFSCAVGVRLDPATAPKVTTLLSRTAMDVGRLNSAAKDIYKRPRPYRRWGGNICTPASPQLDNSLDYPSGHAQLGWSYALILAELAPDRGAAVLARGRAFAESRVVCGVHTSSASEAGMILGSAQVSLARAEPAFRADLDAARAELATLRTNGAKPDPAACARDAELNRTPW